MAKKTIRVITLPQNASIEEADGIYNAMREAIKPSSICKIDFSNTKKIDFPCIQLLISAVTTAKSRNNDLQFVGTVHPELLRELKLGGLIHTDVKSAEDIFEQFRKRV